MSHLRRSLTLPSVLIPLIPLCSPVLAAPAGNAVISIAEIVDEGVLSEDVSITIPLGGGSTEVLVNSHYGIGRNTDIGADVLLGDQDRVLFHATHLVHAGRHTRVRLGVLNLNSAGDETLDAVMGRDIGDTTLHAGVACTMPDATLFGGVTRTLSPAADLHLEYLGGPAPVAAVGVEWSLRGGLGLIASALHDFHGNAGLYLDFIWEHSD